MTARKKTGNKVSSIASKAMKTGKATPREIRSMGASLLSQDEHKGKRPKK
ncbi:MAG: hypothetical protein L3J89_06030 [Gammaproteobacteria bacterium]|nr:hypothetical protein [Gammaproteobacteria bacterium]